MSGHLASFQEVGAIRFMTLIIYLKNHTEAVCSATW